MATTRNISASPPEPGSERGMGWRAIALALALALSGAAAAQTEGLPLVVVDQERILQQSLAGKALLAEEEALTTRLIEERRSLERAFEEEERALAARRDELSREAFAREAADFDARVRAARTAQDEKAIALQRSIEANRKRFLDSLQPVLVEVMQRFGASVMLDVRAVLLADPSLDVTGEVISRLDELYRAGQEDQTPPDRP
ncbi:MAG: OmpH family outer membrane protein [Alphaproteobacteria bacterium]|nr:MAG: OmpH family outer membrane protein [Alphaproteobacteria bacterium]